MKRHSNGRFARGGGNKKTYEEESKEVEHEAGLKRGGKVKHIGKVHGGHSKHRLDKRARGGGVGADKHPFSSAHMGKK